MARRMQYNDRTGEFEYVQDEPAPSVRIAPNPESPLGTRPVAPPHRAAAPDAETLARPAGQPQRIARDFSRDGGSPAARTEPNRRQPRPIENGSLRYNDRTGEFVSIGRPASAEPKADSRNNDFSLAGMLAGIVLFIIGLCICMHGTWLGVFLIVWGFRKLVIEMNP